MLKILRRVTAYNSNAPRGVVKVVRSFELRLSFLSQNLQLASSLETILAPANLGRVNFSSVVSIGWFYRSTALLSWVTSPHILTLSFFFGMTTNRGTPFCGLIYLLDDAHVFHSLQFFTNSRLQWYWNSARCGQVKRC